MNARSPEDSSSNEPNERHDSGGVSPSFDLLLGKTLEMPREWADYLDALITDRYPIGGRDAGSSINERVLNKKISWKLHLYEKDITSKAFSDSIDEFRKRALIDPDLRPFNAEFTPPIINRHAMHMLYQAFIPSQYKSQDEHEIRAVQTQLALESFEIYQYQQSISRQDGRYLDKQRLDIDAMITLLANVQTNNVEGIPGIAVIANPHYDAVEPIYPRSDFLVFTPNAFSTFDVDRVMTAEVLPKDARPGAVAIKTLQEAKTPEMAGTGPFEDPHELGRLWVAKRAIAETMAKKKGA